LLKWLSRLFGRVRRGVSAPRSRFDAAKTGPENREHWRGADALSPNAAANAADRKTLRERARYEVANNSFAFGAANALAEDAIGTGPRLQLFAVPEPKTGTLVGRTSIERREELARLRQTHEDAVFQVEREWQKWCDAVSLGDSLRVLYRAGVVDGEGFALAVDNPKLAHPVKLDWRVFECDRVTDPAPGAAAGLVDGIEFDAAGNPTKYKILREHPGDSGSANFGPGEFDTYPADFVYHWFRADRPGQARGVSWLTPALPLFAQMRRYTLAVLSAAEFAANITGILKSQLPPGGDGEAVQLEDFDSVPIPRGTLLTLPPGYDASGFDAKQPTSTFGDFRTQILVEIGRALDMPLNRITGNSSGYNYSSGRLDHLGYHAGIWRHRDRLRLRILDKLFRAWLDEAALVGLIPDGLPPFAEWAWDWQWDAFGDIDPMKDAQAAQALLDANLTDLAEQCAARGRRWDQVLRQRAREMALMAELGLTAAADEPGEPADPEDEPDADGEAGDGAEAAEGDEGESDERE
jgi:lambda family phage portal protein